MKTIFWDLHLLVCSILTFAVSFAVEVPPRPITVTLGATASLPCEFISDQNPSNLVVTWQRVEDNRVVHSYYYQRDQLDRQSSHYRNRTELNHKQLLKGNATLAILNFGPEDEGKYLCSVTNNLNTVTGEVQLIYAAYYSEPRLSIHLDSSDVTIQYETEGFPKPEVVWMVSEGQNTSDQLEVWSEDKRLYHLRSSYTLKNAEFNITFTLKNPAVHQEMQRQVTFRHDGNRHHSVVILAILCIAFMCSTCVLLFLHCRKFKSHHEMEMSTLNHK